MVREGDSFLAIGRFDDAIVAYSHALAIDSKNGNALINRGVAYLKLRDWDESITDFTGALSMDPRYAFLAYLNRAQAREAKGDNDGAMADYEASLRVNPDAVDALDRRGFLKQSKGEWEGAIADYSRAIAVSPNDAQAYRGRGYAELSLARYDAAIIDLSEAISLEPSKASTYRFRSNAYAGRNQRQLAARDEQMYMQLETRQQ